MSPKVTKSTVMTFIVNEIDKISDRSRKNDYKYIQGIQRKQNTPNRKHN